jgi:hypothetical protein
MPLGALTIRAEPSPVSDALAEAFALTAVAGDADIAVGQGPPSGSATHVIVTGALDDAVDDWDSEVAPQTIAGALWLPPAQAEATEAALAWLILRLQMPTTPLSDLTDNNGRALRWSVAAACTVAFPGSQSVEIDPDEVKAWVDEQPAVVDLGAAVQRVGGETADAVLASAQRLHTALEALVPLGAAAAPTPALDAAVAEHLRQVQRSGFARWRGAKARAASLAAIQQAARGVAGERLNEVIAARHQQVGDESKASLEAGFEQSLRESILAAVQALELPVEPDFDKVPRSWATGAPKPRRYVFVNEEHLDVLGDLGVTVRPAELPPHRALCTIVASGFSLPALR